MKMKFKFPGQQELPVNKFSFMDNRLVCVLSENSSTIVPHKHLKSIHKRDCLFANKNTLKQTWKN